MEQQLVGSIIDGKPYLIDLGQHLHLRPMQYSQGQADHLQILTPRRCRDVPRLRPHIIDDALL